MNPLHKPSAWRRVLLASAAIVAVLGLNGSSCVPAMEQNINQRFVPDVIQAQDAAAAAKECGTGVGTPAQAAAAAAAAESSSVAGAQLELAIRALRLAYADRERATNARVNVAQQNDLWAAEIAEHQRLAGLALVEAGIEHDIDFMHALELPAWYKKQTALQPNVYTFGNANHLLIRTAYQDMTVALAMAQSAFDACAANSRATPAEVEQLRAWLDEAKLAGGNVTSAHGTGQSLLYSTPDDITQSAVRNAYKTIELGHRARALQMTVELRGDPAERERAAGLREAEAIAEYERLLAVAGDAQRRAQDAANTAYRTAVDCGIDTAPIVPGSPEWNATFWQISSP